ncbi:MAG TPA: enoyl-CoA hydratase [Caulobacterales bacterium]|nr:enoyl-CoA hydratase [Caulobacterales bacterium]
MDQAGEQVRYEAPEEAIARIVLARPERRNAQGVRMTYELDAAFKRAAHDRDVKVIILAADGEDFSAGHDLSYEADASEFAPLGLWGPPDEPGWEGRFARERELYLDITERWRALPKPTIAQVQGRCIAGGNMLAFACDLIVASDDAAFRDNTVDMGVCGAELFNHPFELGVRKAKEWLFTCGWLTAQEALLRGMVNRVASRADLAEVTLDLARTIAKKPMFALRMAKEACNSAQDAMGRVDAQRIAFALHQLCHTDNMLRHGLPITPENLPPKIQEALRERAARAKAKTQSAKGE